MEEKTAKPVVGEITKESVHTPTPRVNETPVTTQLQNIEEGKPVAGDMTIPSDPYYTDPMFYEVVNYFGIPQEEYSSAKYKISEIVDYVIKEGKSNKVEDILKGLRGLEEKVQPPAWGERRYTNIYRYVRLASQKQSINQALSAFEKGAKI